MSDADHDWFMLPYQPEVTDAPWEACRRCGFMRRADRMNGPCRGAAPVEPRSDVSAGEGDEGGEIEGEPR